MSDDIKIVLAGDLQQLSTEFDVVASGASSEVQYAKLALCDDRAGSRDAARPALQVRVFLMVMSLPSPQQQLETDSSSIVTKPSRLALLAITILVRPGDPLRGRTQSFLIDCGPIPCAETILMSDARTH